MTSTLAGLCSHGSKNQTQSEPSQPNPGELRHQSDTFKSDRPSYQDVYAAAGSSGWDLAVPSP
jgi:hypothetical protein